ncbi:MAG: hypothetical protein PUP93_04750 [Rhizonema sp. NSF051]|nr:hypothetical protein [Rhizonema sp. NSF051]
MDAKNIRFGDSDDCAVARIAKLFMQSVGTLIPDLCFFPRIWLLEAIAHVR